MLSPSHKSRILRQIYSKVAFSKKHWWSYQQRHLVNIVKLQLCSAKLIVRLQQPNRKVTFEVKLEGAACFLYFGFACISTSQLLWTWKHELFGLLNMMQHFFLTKFSGIFFHSMRLFLWPLAQRSQKKKSICLHIVFIVSIQGKVSWKCIDSI